MVVVRPQASRKTPSHAHEAHVRSGRSGASGVTHSMYCGDPTLFVRMNAIYVSISAVTSCGPSAAHLADPTPTPPPRGEGLPPPALTPPSFPGKGVGGLGCPTTR